MIKKIDVSTDLQLENYISSGLRVEVWIGGELDYYGRLFAYTSDSIEIHDKQCYLRENCKLKSRKTFMKLIQGGLSNAR